MPLYQIINASYSYNIEKYFIPSNAIDISLLKISLPSTLPSLKLCSKSPSSGDSILIYQFSLFEDIPLITRGIISKCIKHKGKCVLYQLDAFCYSGSSGAPLLNSNNELIGIVCENVIIGENIQIPNIAFAISFDVLKDIITYKDNIEKLKELYWFNLPSTEIKKIFSFSPKSKY